MQELTEPPQFLMNNIFIFLLAWGGYYLGIVIRKVVFKTGPPMKHQFLLGIPISCVMLAPFIPLLQATISDWSVLATFGIIVEHGMVVNETATDQIQKLAKKLQQPAMGTAGG